MDGYVCSWIVWTKLTFGVMSFPNICNIWNMVHNDNWLGIEKRGYTTRDSHPPNIWEVTQSICFEVLVANRPPVPPMVQWVHHQRNQTILIGSTAHICMVHGTAVHSYADWDNCDICCYVMLRPHLISDHHLHCSALCTSSALDEAGLLDLTGWE